MNILEEIRNCDICFDLPCGIRPAVCAPFWHPKIINQFTEKPLIILIGQYAQKYYLQKRRKANLTETVRNFEEYLPEYFVLPHPSPRNQNWVMINPWFTDMVLPRLREEVHARLR